MRSTALVVAFVVGGLVTSFGWHWSQPAAAQRASNTARQAADGELLALSTSIDGGSQQLLLIDPKGQAVSVYHIDRLSGEIALKSVRNVRHDLKIDYFNCATPLPSEVRALLEDK